MKSRPQVIRPKTRGARKVLLKKPNAAPSPEGSERLQKIIAAAGLASRREVEDWIREGLVTVNGRVAQLGDKAIAGKDAIKVKGKLLQAGGARVYLLFHKPRGVISMMSEDPMRRPTLKDYFRKMGQTRVFPVGRLDFHADGLVLLTNDGEFAARMQKDPGLKRVFHVKVSSHPSEHALSRLVKGTRLEGRVIQPRSVKMLDLLTQKAKIELVFEGAGAIDLKGLFERAGLVIEKTSLVSIGPYAAKDLPRGTYRALSTSQAHAILGKATAQD